MKTIYCLGLAVAATAVANAAETPLASGAAPVSAGPQALAEFSARAEGELRTNILPFWLKHALNPKTNGFFGTVNDDLTPVKSAPRGSLLTSRILWTFSAAYRRYKEPAYLDMARLAYDDLVTRFWDEQNGGLYWTITPGGKPADTSKQIYDQVFGIYGLSEYYRTTSDPAAMERAIALYRLVEKYAHDPVNGGYYEVFSRDWHREPSSKSPVNPLAEKSQNTHLHVMEAFTSLFRVWPDAGLKDSLRALLELMLTRIYDGKTHHLQLFLSADWRSQSDGISYGHDIEAAWLLTEAAGVLGDSDLIERTRRAAVDIAETTLKEGIDAEGGLCNEGGPGGVTDRSRDWWPQAEAVVGFLNAYQITGHSRFLAASQRSWAFIDRHMIDHERGEWFESVSAAGIPKRSPKISLWKCPYHNGRSCLEVVERVAELEARAKP